jgi:hypothetical protein
MEDLKEGSMVINVNFLHLKHLTRNHIIRMEGFKMFKKILFTLFWCTNIRNIFGLAK